MTILNMGTDTAPKWFAVATVSINGKEQEIIPAFTEYSIQRKDFSKDKIYEKIDKSKILPTVFCFAKPDIFIKENVRLFDYSGRELTDVPNEAPQIMVYLDKADNINLLDLDIPLKAELIDCESVADAYQTLSKILCKWKQDSVVGFFLYLDSVFKNKHKLIHNQAPVMNRLCPFLLNLHK